MRRFQNCLILWLEHFTLACVEVFMEIYVEDTVGTCKLACEEAEEEEEEEGK